MCASESETCRAKRQKNTSDRLPLIFQEKLNNTHSSSRPERSRSGMIASSFRFFFGRWLPIPTRRPGYYTQREMRALLEAPRGWLTRNIATRIKKPPTPTTGTTTLCATDANKRKQNSQSAKLEAKLAPKAHDKSFMRL